MTAQGFGPADQEFGDDNMDMVGNSKSILFNKRVPVVFEYGFEFAPGGSGYHKNTSVKQKADFRKG